MCFGVTALDRHTLGPSCQKGSYPGEELSVCTKELQLPEKAQVGDSVECLTEIQHWHIHLLPAIHSGLEFIGDEQEP